ncbi:uncharacterized protein RHOBADRAFT_45465 [Rhodotorula graminis WP1]|uniref:F-box domain-containing protein n=1 Tax=Rhodotorula graminis (strain WP1) TaxID=578459 RepID=A0A0P9FCS0_RHOGW|nr:uncharacterized protein RHOBADRAFT_45465 [Rhodotorula graminis WP1]KPV73502.1 hypothetical protein RHOBADRAFT_45465 [Rhodotorula graminis WP1]
MQANPSTTALAAASDPALPARAPRRLPDELIVMVVEQTRDWDYESNAALCRLAKRFQAPAERILYEHVGLDNAPSERERDIVSALHTLVHYPRFRPYVKSVLLSINGATIADVAPEVLNVLCHLPNVEHVKISVASTCPSALPLLLLQPTCRLRSFETRYWSATMLQWVRDYPHAFAILEELSSEDASALVAAQACPAVKRLAISMVDHEDARWWASAAASVEDRLTSLTLAVESHDLLHFVRDFSGFRRLEELVLYLVYHPHPEQVASAIEVIVEVLRSLPRSSGVTSLELSVTVDVERPTGASSSSLPVEVTDILLSLPPKLHTLILNTNAIRPVDLATYLLSSLRPPALRTLRVGGELGTGLRALIDDADGVHGALAGELERAGIEVEVRGWWR